MNSFTLSIDLYFICPRAAAAPEFPPLEFNKGLNYFLLFLSTITEPTVTISHLLIKSTLHMTPTTI